MNDQILQKLLEGAIALAAGLVFGIGIIAAGGLLSMVLG